MAQFSKASISLQLLMTTVSERGQNVKHSVYINEKSFCIKGAYRHLDKSLNFRRFDLCPFFKTKLDFHVQYNFVSLNKINFWVGSTM